MDSGSLENFPIRTKVHALLVVQGNPQKPLLCRIGLAEGEN